VAAVLLALLTALCYGLANFFAPLLTRQHALAAVLVVGQTVGVIGAGAFLAVAHPEAPDALHLTYGLLAGVGNAIALAALYPAAAAGPLSIVIPLSATGGVVPVLVAIAEGERPSALQALGLPIAVVGVVLAAARKAEPAVVLPDGTPGPAKHAAPRTIALTLVSVLGLGAFLTFLGKASTQGPEWAIFSSRLSLVVCTVTFVLVRRPPVAFPRAALGRLAVPGVLLLVGTVAYAEATTRGLVSVVAMLATLAPVVTVALAVLLLGERLAPRQQVGVATTLVGVVLLAAG